jgi:serine protease Do
MDFFMEINMSRYVSRIFFGLTAVALSFLFSANLRAETTALPDFVSLTEKYSHTVVKIETETKVRSRAKPRGFGPGIPDEQVPEIFRHFFGDPRGFQQPYEMEMPPRQAMGSGFVVSADGYILTNNHVVDGADKIIVNLNDGNEHIAKLMGTDPRSDLALLKIEANHLSSVKFSQRPVKVGEWVLAIGSPFGLDYSVSQGIVSAIGRSLPAQDNSNYVPFIQTDVAINPGNSGGPLFNLQGEVVGINSQIFTRSGGYMGLSFAIPADLAQSVVTQLRDKGYVSRGWLGVSIQDVDAALAKSFGLDKPRGALVAQLVENSPAKGVLENGDIILEFQGVLIKKSGDLPHVVGVTPAGTQATLKILRQGKEKLLILKLGELPDEPRSVGEIPQRQVLTDNPLGLVVDELDDKTQKELAIAGGVVVREVMSDSPADITGLIPGDVITDLGRVAINNKADFKKQSMALAKKTPQPIRFFRRGQPVFRTILVE